VRFDGTRITLRLQRFELVAFGFGLGGLVVALLMASLYLTSLQPGPDCRVINDANGSACQVVSDRFNEAQGWLGGLLLTPTLLVTFAIGLFLGAPIVARELERGTVRLAWALAPSRWRWYASRLLPILGVVVALTFLAGVALDQFFAASRPGADLSRSFEGYGIRGGLLAARAIFVFAVAVVVGAAMGRALPTVIVATLVATIGLAGGISVHERIIRGEAVAIPVDMTGSGTGGAQPGDRYIDQRFVLPDGSLVGYDYFYDGGEGDPYDENGNPKYPMVDLVVPGERYRAVEAREAAVLLAGSLVALLMAGFVVARRRPG
jgi:ABC-type transport system involved in multi-copper enzyme maturation permease subunit